MNLLFTCAGRRNYLINYFKKALHSRGKIVAIDGSLSAPALVDADKGIKVPEIYHPSYIDTLKNIIVEEEIHAVISLNDLELPILAAHKNILQKAGAQILVSGSDVIDIAFDKWKTYQFIKGLGLNTPQTYVNYDEAVKAIEEGELLFPLVLKPRWGSASIGIEFPENFDEFSLSFKLQNLKLKKTILNNAGSDPTYGAIMIQQKLSGQEYGMDIVNDFHGNYYGTFARKKLSMRSGETDKAVSVIRKDLESLGSKIGSELGHIGSMDCDVFEENGDLYLLELNPRFGGGYPFSHESGANIAAMYLEWMKGGNDIARFNNYRDGITYSKCDRLIEIPSSVKI